MHIHFTHCKVRIQDVEAANNQVNKLNLVLDKTKNDPDKLARQAVASHSSCHTPTDTHMFVAQ